MAKDRAQRSGVNASKGLIQSSIAEKLDLTNLLHSNSFRIADLGCSVGPNTFIAVQNIIEAVDLKHKSSLSKTKPIEYHFFFSDHTFNDFNTLITQFSDNKINTLTEVSYTCRQIQIHQTQQLLQINGFLVRFFKETPLPVLDVDVGNDVPPPVSSDSMIAAAISAADLGISERSNNGNNNNNHHHHQNQNQNHHSVVVDNNNNNSGGEGGGGGAELAAESEAGGGGGDGLGTWQTARFKADILAHPLYDQLLSAHVACLRIATPVDQLPRIDAQLAQS